MMDSLSWFKHRIDVMIVPWLMLVAILIFNIINNVNAGMIVVSIAYFLPAPFFVKLHGIYRWCASWYRQDMGIVE